jgi:hypothetical protein
MSWVAFGAIWALNEKVAFDGPAKQIRVNSDATVIDVKTDLYSAWKRWAQLDDHTKFLPAFRSIGGDPLGGGLFAGDLYFLTNGWQVVIDHSVTVNGVLYHDDSIPVFVIEPGGGVTSTVSNLTQTAVSTQNVVTGDISSVPSVADIVAQVLAALNATTIPVDAKKMNGADVIGTGAENDPWRGLNVQP